MKDKIAIVAVVSLYLITSSSVALSKSHPAHGPPLTDAFQSNEKSAPNRLQPKRREASDGALQALSVADFRLIKYH